MPYAPAAHFDASPLERGISSIGLNYAKGVAEAGAKAQEHDYWTQKGRDMAQTLGPDGKPLMSVEQLQKFEAGGLGAKKAMVSDSVYNYEKGLQQSAQQFSQGMQSQHLALADRTEANRTAIAKSEIDATEGRFQTTRADHEAAAIAKMKFEADKAKYEAGRGLPQPVPGMPGRMYVPKTGQQITFDPSVDTTKPPEVSPDGKFYRDHSGWHTMPQKADPYAQLGPYGGGLGAPAAAATGGTPAPTSIPAASRTPAPTDPYKVGLTYADAQGRTRKYLGNGQWANPGE